MKLATTTDDLRPYAATQAEAVRLFEGTGFRHLDFSFYNMNFPGSPLLGPDWMREIEAAAQAAREIGVDFVQAHSPSGAVFDGQEAYDALVLSTKRSIEACGFLGIKNIVVHPVFANGFNAPHWGRDGYLEANRRFFEHFFPEMEKYGVQALVENTSETNSGMPAQTAPGQSEGLFFYAEDMLEVLDFIGHPLLHACWDTGHAAMRHMDQYAALKTLGPRLKALHIQDNFGKTDDHIAPFQGVLNLDEILCGLIDSGYDGCFTFEATNILRRTDAWPIYRHKWTGDTRLMHPPVELMRKAVGLMYEIGRHALTAYHLYEE